MTSSRTSVGDWEEELASPDEGPFNCRVFGEWKPWVGVEDDFLNLKSKRAPACKELPHFNAWAVKEINEGFQDHWEQSVGPLVSLFFGYPDKEFSSLIEKIRKTSLLLLTFQ